MLVGIAPESLLLDRSREDNWCIFEMLLGICPLVWFLDKFRTNKPVSFVNSSGSSPSMLFPERSMLVTRERVFVCSCCPPFVIIVKLSS